MRLLKALGQRVGRGCRRPRHGQRASARCESLARHRRRLAPNRQHALPFKPRIRAPDRTALETAAGRIIPSAGTSRPALTSVQFSKERCIMLTLPADPLTALQQQCAGIVGDNNRCTPRVAAGLTWLSKGLEQHYGPLVMERAKAKFTEVHGLPVNELLLIKAYFVRFQSWDNGDCWIDDKYLDSRCSTASSPSTASTSWRVASPSRQKRRSTRALPTRSL